MPQRPRRPAWLLGLLLIPALALAAPEQEPPAKAGAAGADELGKRVFTRVAQPTCATCHTLADAGATGAIGPDLDEMRPAPQQVRRAVELGIGAMPAFGDVLSEAEIDAVARYVARAASH